MRDTKLKLKLIKLPEGYYILTSISKGGINSILGCTATWYTDIISSRLILRGYLGVYIITLALGKSTKLSSGNCYASGSR
jgi:hypothetical protein